MTRLAVVATPARSGSGGSAPGVLDGDAVRARLSLADADFAICDLDPATDLAEQLDALFDRRSVRATEPVLFYASSRAVLAADGEFFLCLDDAHPETGDALADLAQVLVDRASGPLLFVLECRHRADWSDPQASAAVVAAARAAIQPMANRIGLLIAAGPDTGRGEESPSHFTRAFLEVMDDAPEDEGLSAEGLFKRIRQSERLAGLVPCFAFFRGEPAFEILAAPARPPAPPPREATGLEWPAPHPPQPPPPHEVLDAPAATVMSSPRAAASASLREASPIAPSSPPVAPAVSAFQAPFSDSPPVLAVSDSPAVRALADSPPVMPAMSDSPALPDSPPEPALSDSPSPPIAAPVEMSERPAPSSSEPPVSSNREIKRAPRTVTEHIIIADSLALAQNPEGALAQLKKALVLAGPSATRERAEIHVRIGEVKREQGKPREAIASFEKALQIIPAHPGAQVALLELSVADRDWRAVHVAEERLLASMTDPTARFARLVEFGTRWMNVAKDISKARAAFEMARDISGDDLNLLGQLREVYEMSGSEQEAYATRREIARLTPDPRERAKQYFELAQSYRLEKKRDDVALILLDHALDSDPSMLEPLEILAALLAERQEWGELEKAYRKMLDRAPRIPSPAVRTEVTWELCRRLGLLFRDHFEDPRLALDAFEDSLEEKPNDLGGHIVAADLAKGLGEIDKAIAHLQVAARLDPARLETFHHLFELFQRNKQPDLAFCAASIAVQKGQAEARERFIFEEHRAPGVPKFRRRMRPEAWDLLRPDNRDQLVEAVLVAIAPTAIATRAADLAREGRLPVLDPASRQDPEKSTASIARSFTWASHFLSIPAPAVYVREEMSVGILAVLGEDPALIAGSGVLRGKSLPELAFLVGRHLGYHAGVHRILLSYPTIEDLSACFIAAVTIALPGVPVPSSKREAAAALRASYETRLDDADLAALTAAVEVFDEAGGRADLRGWARSVERCATRAGAILCGDLGVVASILEAEPRGFLTAEDKVADLAAFWVSNEHHLLRAELGVDIEP